MRSISALDVKFLQDAEPCAEIPIFATCIEQYFLQCIFEKLTFHVSFEKITNFHFPFNFCYYFGSMINGRVDFSKLNYNNCFSQISYQTWVLTHAGTVEKCA